MSTWGIILKYINLWKTQSNHGCLGMIREGSEGWRKFWGWYAGADYGDTVMDVYICEACKIVHEYTVYCTSVISW